MKNTVVQRLLLALLPAMVIVGIVVSTIWGDNGLLARHTLRQELRAETQDLASVERDNQRRLRELQVMERDPVVVERMVAEELSWGRPGTTIYRFKGSALR